MPGRVESLIPWRSPLTVTPLAPPGLPPNPRPVDFERAIRDRDDWIRQTSEIQRGQSEALQSLSSWADVMQQAMQWGPVPGAYLPLTFVITGAVAVVTAFGKTVTPAQMQPLFFSVGLRVDNCTARIRVNGTTLCTKATSGGIGYLNTAGDFSTDTIDAFATLTCDVTAIAGAPIDLTVVLYAKRVGQIEQV